MRAAALHSAMRRRLRELGIDVERHLRDHTLQFPPQALGAGDWLDRAKAILCRGRRRSRPAVRWLEEGVWVQSPRTFPCRNSLSCTRI